MSTVRDILRSKGNLVWSISPEALVYEALELMADKDVGALIVRDGSKVVGVFSERDYARRVVLMGRSSRGVPVRDLMSKRIVCVPPDESVDTCMQLMTGERVRHLPVMEKDKLVGIVTIGDVVKQIMSDQHTTINDLTHYIRGGR